ncbi:MAG: helix-turn-helix transcriptional regulator [Lachnospiraceae bacterium]
MGEKLRSLRIEKNLTQKQVADRIGLAISAVSSYESGSRYPTYDTLIKLARMFHVSTDYLLGIADKRNIDVTGLDDEDVGLISQLVDKLRK